MATKFSELTQQELYRSAIEDFAVDVKSTDSKKSIEAALLESGVYWKDYVLQHPEHAPVEAPPVVADAAVITTQALTPKAVVHLAEEPVRNAGEQFLVKMHRENPYFEFGRYKFTKNNPFVVMDAESTDRLLEEEEGFAIAKPSEAALYYQK